MNKLNVVIIEDEVPAARLLNSMVTRLRPEWNVTVLPGVWTKRSCVFAEHPHPDIIFSISSWRREFVRFPFGKLLPLLFFTLPTPVCHPCLSQ